MNQFIISTKYKFIESTEDKFIESTEDKFIESTEDNEDKINIVTKKLIDEIMDHNEYNIYVDVRTPNCYLTFSEYTLDKIQNNFVHKYDYTRHVIFDFNENTIIFNCDEYLKFNKNDPKTISVSLYFGGKTDDGIQIGHAAGIIIYDSTLEFIDSLYLLELFIKNEDNNIKFEKFMCQLKEKLCSYDIHIDKIIHSSKIIPKIQDYEERTHIFLNNTQRNKGNCSFWSALLMEIRVRNINMNHTEFYDLMNKSIIPYITKKTYTLYIYNKIGK
jgi:hypothetical protein